MKKIFAVFIVFINLISCSKESQTETFSDFIKNSYFESSTKKPSGLEIYSYDLVQFELSDTCLFRIKSQFVIDDNCRKDGLNICIPTNGYYKDFVITDTGAIFSFSVDGENYARVGDLLWYIDEERVTLRINGEAQVSWQAISKKDWESKYSNQSCSEL